MNKQKGFSFLEAIISITILTIGIIAILQVFPTAFNIGLTSQRETQAIFLCQEKIESINETAFENIIVGVETETQLNAPFEKFSRETTIIFVDSNLEESAPETEMKKISVIVSWKSPLKILQKETEIITLVAKK